MNHIEADYEIYNSYKSYNYCVIPNKSDKTKVYVTLFYGGRKINSFTCLNSREAVKNTIESEIYWEETVMM